MVKLPMSDYVADYYKKQGIEFTFRQQAHFCWYYNDLLKEKMESLKEILKISDDEKLNTEIRERIKYEEKSYECFMAGHDGCIYIVCLDDEDEYDEEYFASVEKAVVYGRHHCNKEFKIIKSWLFDKNPEGLSEEANHDDLKNVNGCLSWYTFTPEGDVIYSASNECKAPFDEEDYTRFENMFLNIKSPFGLGDIVMGPDFERPEVVSTDHDCFFKTYDKFRNHPYIPPDATDNTIRTDLVNENGNLDYAHTLPFKLWKVDSWEDKEYWEILQILSKAVKAGVDVFRLEYPGCEYAKHHSEEKP